MLLRRLLFMFIDDLFHLDMFFLNVVIPVFSYIYIYIYIYYQDAYFHLYYYVYE